MQLWVYAVDYIDKDGQLFTVEVDALDEASAMDFIADDLELDGKVGRPVSARRTGQKGEVLPD